MTRFVVLTICSIFWLTCTPGIDESYYGTGALGEACSNDLECQQQLICLDGICALEGTYPVQWGTEQMDVAYAIAADEQGYLYVGGSTNGALTPSGSQGEADATLTKISRDGAILWHEQFGLSGQDAVGSVKIGPSGNVYITGVLADPISDVFLAKYTPERELIWLTRFGTEEISERAYSMAMDSKGYIYVAGCTHCPDFAPWLPEKPIGAKAILLKYSPDGALMWDTTWGDHGDDRARDVCLDSNGDVIVGGYYSAAASTDATDNPVWHSQIRKLSPSGQLLFESTWIAPAGQNSIIRSVSADSAGNIFGVGSVDLQIDDSNVGNIVLLRWGHDGQLIWSRTHGGQAADWPFRILVHDDNRLLITGSTANDLDGSSQSGWGDVFLIEYNPAGDHVQTTLWGSVALDAASALTVNASGTIHLTGNTWGRLSNVANQGSSDMFVLRVQ